MAIKHVCSAAHECPVEGCSHKVPHDGSKCGPAMTCYDSKLLSGCVPLDSNGEYEVVVSSKTCPCCNGSGREVLVGKFKPGVDND